MILMSMVTMALMIGILFIGRTSSGFYDRKELPLYERVLIAFDPKEIGPGEVITIVNKKKPVIIKTVGEDVSTDKEFTFNIYEKETNTLVKTVKLKANEAAYLDTKVEEAGIVTGELEDGKTYIIREEVDDSYIQELSGKNGDIKSDDTSEYYEFTYDASLSKIFEVRFNNITTKVTIKKQDKEGNRLKGCVLEVYDEKNNKIDEFTTGDDDYVIYGLKVGEEYTIKESKALDGYKKADDVKFKIPDGEIETEAIVINEKDPEEEKKEDIIEKQELINKDNDNPKTGDNIVVVSIIGLVAIIVLGIIKVKNK